MVARAHIPAARRRGPTVREGLRLVVFHASRDVQAHVAPLKRSRRFKVSCYPQRSTEGGSRSATVDAVLWELAPGRRPNWRRLKAMARGMPIVSYSGTQDRETAARSRAIGFACHLDAPLSAVEVEHQVALASPVDLATRLRQTRLLRRYLGRVEVFNEMHRAVNASLEPGRVADALAERAAAWLPVSSWAVVGRGEGTTATVLAECGLATNADKAARAVGAWVLDHSRIYSVANLRTDPVIVDAPDAAAIAIPLMCRGQTIAALVGIDREPAPRAPRFSPSMVEILRLLLEPAAYALENAFRVQRAEALSVTDDLTQLHNSRYLAQALRRESKRAVRSGQPLSVLFVDLDGFKGVNDQHGHLFGSRALVEVALIIRDCSRETDIASRFGGDEFAVVLPDTGSEGAMAVATRVRDRVRQHLFLKEAGINYRLTASVGVATMPDAATTVDGLLQAADDAMYTVKAHGKDGVFLAGAPAEAGVLSREDRSA